RILHHGLGACQVFKREVELALAAMNLRHADVGLGILGIRIGDDLELFESGVGLAVVQQVASQAADGVEIVVIKRGGLAVGVDGLLVIFLLLVGVTENGIKLGGTRCVRDGTQNLRGAGSVTFVVIKIGERGDRLFRVGIDFDRGLELGLSLLQFV